MSTVVSREPGIAPAVGELVLARAVGHLIEITASTRRRRQRDGPGVLAQITVRARLRPRGGLVLALHTRVAREPVAARAGIPEIALARREHAAARRRHRVRRTVLTRRVRSRRGGSRVLVDRTVGALRGTGKWFVRTCETIRTLIKIPERYNLCNHQVSYRFRWVIKLVYVQVTTFVYLVTSYRYPFFFQTINR